MDTLNSDDESNITPSCCPHVMDQVARKEERRLIRTLFFVGPLLIVCSWLVIIAIHMSITRYLESQAITAVTDVESETHSFSENVFVIFQLFLSQLKSDVFVLMASSLTIFGAIIAKSKLYSFPYRVKEIKKFKLIKKSETVTTSNA
jgi:hypothetical protein